MKNIKVWSKIHRFLAQLWDSIQDAMSPNWAGMVPLEDKQSDEVRIDISSDSRTNQAELVDDANKAKEALSTTDELHRAKLRVLQLEEQIKQYKAFEEVEKRLREALQNNSSLGKRGRPKKAHKKITFNMYSPWAILYEVGTELQFFKSDKTDFLNSAVEEFFKHEYSDLYSLYLNSLKDETINREYDDDS